ncbi:hypothetical protein [Xanthomonas sacchari]|uniref:hypothetical protein n=1 Tax=Xanthomonas sacchari TaxID=56458 RepID=UPI00224FC065|nr:hypothetical protein [Xanthomonas sacchari]
MKTRFLWIIWLALLVGVAVVLVLHLARPSVVSGVYTALALCSLAVLGIQRRMRVSRAIAQVNPALDAYLTYVPFLKGKGINDFRAINWLFSAGSTGSARLDALRADQKRFLLWTVSVILSIPVVNIVSSFF